MNVGLGRTSPDPYELPGDKVDHIKILDREEATTSPELDGPLTADQMFALNMLKASDVHPEKVTH